jgi:hypothetical protein
MLDFDHRITLWFGVRRLIAYVVFPSPDFPIFVNLERDFEERLRAKIAVGVSTNNRAR